jgi:DNA-binding CsgD family transcriptional regulator
VIEAAIRAFAAVATRAGTMTELGAEISRHIGRLVPHDGYMLMGFDPATGVVCFRTAEHGYSIDTARRMHTDDTLGLDPLTGLDQAEIRKSTRPQPGHHSDMRDLMAADGFGSEVRIALTTPGVLWGALCLVRETTSTPFSITDLSHLHRLATPLVRALHRFVVSTGLGTARISRPPGVILIGPDDTISTATSSGRDWLRDLVPDAIHTNDAELLCGAPWHAVHTARRTATPAVSRIPTPHGWIALHAQPVHPDPNGAVALTIQPANTHILLPTVAAWYGLSPRERTVIEHAVQGIPIKRIARQLDLSQHTVKEHLTAIYRKTGVTSRDELTATLGH